MDAFHTPYWHTRVENTAGHRWLSFSIAAQAGTNSGLNEVGLGVVISGSDPRWISDEAPGWDIDEPPIDMSDARTVANAAILGRCSTVDQAVDFMSEWVPAHPGMMGGNSLFADASGRIAVVEHCAGEMAVRDTTEAGWASQANNSYVLVPDQEARRPGIADSYPRCAAMERFLTELRPLVAAGLSDDELRKRAQAFLGSHGEPDGDQVGSMCIHEFDLPGARANVALPMWTITGLVFDLTRPRMHFTRGNPCEGQWDTLDFPTDQRG
jgi:hypothetical protein